jgi:hypothetical protein
MKNCDGEFWARTIVFPRRSLAVLMESRVEEERQHVDGGPADVDVARGEGVAHGHRIVDENELDLEVLALAVLPGLAGLEAVVGVDDGRPTRPHVDGELDGAIGQRLVVGDAFHLGELLGRGELILLHRGDAGGVGRLGPCPRGLGEVIGRDVVAARRLGATLATATHTTEAVGREADQPEHHQGHRDVERRLRPTTVRHFPAPSARAYAPW